MVKSPASFSAVINSTDDANPSFSLLFGNETVKETVDHEFTGAFVREAIFNEIIPTLSLPEEELKTFAEEVLDRFRNPFIKHQLASIALNSVSKFKVRVLPSLLAYENKCNRLPLHLTFAFACLIRFYRGEWNNQTLPINDDESVVAELKRIWELHSYQEISEQALKNEKFWDQDLTQVPGLKDQVAMALELIETKGIEEGYNKFVSKVAVE